MALPQYTGRKYFSASISNTYTRSLLTSYNWAISPRPAFSGLREAASGDPLWSGYILYTGDTNTFRYRYNQASGGTGATTIKVNGTIIHTNSSGNGTSAGTTSISGLSLTAGEVYSVTVHNTAGSTDPYWLGLSQTISYTAPPSFSNGNVLTDTQLNTIRTGLTQLESAQAMPHTPNVMGRRGAPGHRNGEEVSGTAIMVWRGFFYHTHNTLRYRFRHGMNVKKALTEIKVNSTLVASSEDASLDTVVSGTASLSGLSLTRGNVYEATVELGRSGTSNTTSGHCWVYEMSQETSASATPPPTWAHGGTNISATNMNRYSTIINTIHPGAGSPAAPLYYEQPALRVDDSGYRYYIQHRRKWLRYRVRTDTAGKTVELEYGPNLQYTYALPSSSGNHSFDLTTLPRGMGVGQWYVVEDSEFACEYDTSQA